MIVGVAGIGLIGGSFARDYKSAGHTVYVYDRTPAVSQYAMLAGVADGFLDETTIPQCDLILIALFPQDTIDYLRKYGPIFNKNGVVMDCGGTKMEITKVGFEVAEKYGFTYWKDMPTIYGDSSRVYRMKIEEMDYSGFLGKILL